MTLYLFSLGINKILLTESLAVIRGLSLLEFQRGKIADMTIDPCYIETVFMPGRGGGGNMPVNPSGIILFGAVVRAIPDNKCF